MGLLLFYLFLALFVSFLCSVMEAVLLSTSKSFLVTQKENGYAWAITFLDFKTHIDKPLSAILTLNTVAHTVGAAGVGAEAVKVFGEASFGIVSAVLTILILVITEIIPKTFGANYWRNLAKPSSVILKGMIFITYPLVIMSAAITKLISKKDKEQTISREEISALANIGADEGIFMDKENIIIQNVLRLKNVRIAEIMTPRVVVALADEEQLLTEFSKNLEFQKFSRIPVFSENDENITGYVFSQTVYEKLAEDLHQLKLKEIKRAIVIVPNSITPFNLLEKLIVKKEHIALIVDEYGGMDGIVSLEDIFETLLGFEIVDEKDTVADMQEYAREQWKKKQADRNELDPITDDKDE